MRTHDLDALGTARVYRHPKTGQIVVDTDSIRRQGFDGDFAGDPDEDDLGDELGDDETGDDLGDDDLGDDDLGDDVGAHRRRRRHHRHARHERRHGRHHVQIHERGWGKTLVSGQLSLAAAGSGTIPIRLQHDFKAEDITFTGSLAGSTVTAIRFGDRLVWDNAAGADVSVFAVTGFFRGLLKGQELRAGLDISINVTLPGAGLVTASIMGFKPTTAR